MRRRKPLLEPRNIPPTPNQAAGPDQSRVVPTASQLLSDHGAAAISIAAEQALLMQKRGDRLGEDEWCQVLREALDLIREGLRSKP